MSRRRHGPLDRLRQPEYTGENRCLPCTVANVVIAAAGSAAVGLLSPVVGVAAFACSLALVYLRGYLVPGTPELTKRYMPTWALRPFGKAPSADAGHVDSGGGVVPEEFLVDLGVVEPCERDDDLCLDAAFREAWRERVREVREWNLETEGVDDALGVDPDRLLVYEHEGLLHVYRDGTSVYTWPSRGALVADVAAAAALDARSPSWSDLSVGERIGVLTGLRAFLERCPSCDGRVTFGEELVDSCCTTREVAVGTCENCGARLFELDVAPPV